jgi:hypothetical protein
MPSRESSSTPTRPRKRSDFQKDDHPRDDGSKFPSLSLRHPIPVV